MVGIAAVAVFAGTAAAEDHGTWSGGPCNTGRVCFYPDSPPGSLLLQSAVRDSNFQNDYYAGGGKLNDRARRARNTFTSMSLHVHQDHGYGGPKWCLSPGELTGVLPFGVASGVSSFRSGTC